MTIDVRLASINEKDLFQNLLQLYMYDFTEFTDVDINQTGLYNILPDFDSYWKEQNDSQPYLIFKNNNIAGFALAKIISTETRRYNYLAHFFILRKYRKQGLGSEVARTIFNSRKGEWELYQLVRNKPAQQFWTRVINEFTNGNYEEKYEEGRRYQTFFSK